MALLRLSRLVLGATLLALLPGCTSVRLEPPTRLGPPLLLTDGGTSRLWLLTKQEEQVVRRDWRRRNITSTEVRESIYHFDLHCHDARTTERLWEKRLLTLKSKEGGNTADARILGPDGDHVWLFLRDRPLAVTTTDATTVIDGPQIEERNATLQGTMPRELKFYAFDGGLVIIGADGRRHVVRAPQFSAQPYQPVSEEHFSRARFNATQWNGGFNMRDFVTRMATLGGRWIGLYTDKEAQQVGNDESGDRLSGARPVIDEGRGVRRKFWTARIGKTKEFRDGVRDRLIDVAPLPETPDYLDGGLLIRQGSAEPHLLENPAGLLVLHRTRIDAEGRVALTRLDESLRERWTARLPIADLSNRYQLPESLLLYGSTQLEQGGVTSWHEFIVNVRLADGATRAWNVTREQKATEPALER